MPTARTLRGDYHSPLYEDELLPALQAVNPTMPREALDDAVYKLKNFESGSLLQKNMIFTDYLQNGVPVKYLVKGEERSGLVYLVDYQHPENNRFTAINQWTVIENSEKRADIVLFVNGLPLVVVELKSPSREETDASAAYRQLRNYMHEIPFLFIYNQVCVMSDMTTSKAGTITSGEDRFMAWKTKDGSYENTQAAQFDTFFEGIFEKQRFLDILQNFICFNVDGANTFKVLAAYHQYFAVKKAIESTKHATVTDGKGGVFCILRAAASLCPWYSMPTICKRLWRAPPLWLSPTATTWTTSCMASSPGARIFYSRALRRRKAARICKSCWLAVRQTVSSSPPCRNSRKPANHCRNAGTSWLWRMRPTAGSTVLPKRSSPNGMKRANWRSKHPLARLASSATACPMLHTSALPVPPISSKDRSTREVFGDYIDIYDMTQAVEDGATRPVYYESRVIHLKLDEQTLRLIDAEYDLMAQNADPYVIEKSKKELGQMEAILGADQTIASLVDDILDHYENYRANLLTGKAMIVAYSRPIAMKIYKRILQLRPDWTEKVGVVMTQGNNDPEEWREIIGNKSHKEELARKFKDNSSPMKIAIGGGYVVDGF